VISKLPPVIEKVFINGMASPSLLSRNSSCLVRTFGRDAEDHTFLSALIQGPFVEVGTVLHETIEIADGAQNIEQVFLELIGQREESLKIDPRRKHYSNLSVSLGSVAWLDRIEMIRSRKGDAKPFAFVREKTAPINSAHRVPQPRSFQFPSTWVEVPLRSDTYNLAGKIDRLQLFSDGSIRITDFKTGEMVDAAGIPKYDYQIQLAAYELLCREHWPNSSIELVLNNGSEVIVEIEPEVRSDLLEKLSVLQSRVAPISQQVVRASEFVSLSSSCLDCSLRHSCGSYRELMTTDSLGQIVGEQDSGLLTDGLGEVVEARVTPRGNVVNLQTQTGRKVQLISDYEWQVSELVKGDIVAFFGFAPLQNRNKLSGKQGLPVSFRDSYRSSRNWSAEVFKV
jgi:hypothetical protein